VGGGGRAASLLGSVTEVGAASVLLPSEVLVDDKSDGEAIGVGSILDDAIDDVVDNDADDCLIDG